MNNRTDPKAFGLAMANVAMSAAHMTYNARRGKKIVEHSIESLEACIKSLEICIKNLRERLPEIQPKKATPAYKKARYGKKNR
ncbi:MAG: hypothetical protein WAV11_02765 [Minisyncoccia bacterium]